MKSFMWSKWYTLLAILFLIIFPIFVNYFVGWPSLFRVEHNNEWIGFFASYFGAIFGGFIGGLLTYLGVKITIKDQNRSRIDQDRRQNRAFLKVSEIYGAALNLDNIQNRSGRLIVTNEYDKALKQNLTDAHFNFIVVVNKGPGIAINCEVKVTITFENSTETFETKVFLSEIGANDRVYVPIDKINDTRQYRITSVLLNYETLLQEKLMIKRLYEVDPNETKVKDVHYIRDDSGRFVEMFSIKGSSTEWLILGNE